MRDLSRHHILLFALFFLALFVALFVGVVEKHRHDLSRHATAIYAPAPEQPAQTR